MDIDFVVTWVNMDDPEWQNEFSKYSGNKDNTKNGVSKARFRDYGFLKYWFRGVEKFAPRNKRTEARLARREQSEDTPRKP